MDDKNRDASISSIDDGSLDCALEALDFAVLFPWAWMDLPI
jgi:hypothetical protein